MNNINKKIDDLFDELEKTYKDYLLVKKQLKQNIEINNLLKEIKRLQKIATNNKDDAIKKEISKLYKKLEGYPLYQSYLTMKEELEIELFGIKEVFEKYFCNILKL